MIDPQTLDFTVEWILKEEGGVGDVGDGKGLTRWGQTMPWLEKWGLPVPTSRDEAKANYLTWMGLTRLDQLCAVPDMLPVVVADFAIHSGEPAPIKAFQAAVGASPDGVIGPQTIACLAAASRNVAAHQVLARRIEWIGGIFRRDPSQTRYARNWMARIARQLRRLGRE